MSICSALIERRNPFAFADDGKRLAVARAPRLTLRRGSRSSRPAPMLPILGPAAVVVLALAEPADHADRHASRIDGDDRVHPIGLARPAEVFDGLAGAVGSHPQDLPGPQDPRILARSNSGASRTRCEP